MSDLDQRERAQLGLQYIADAVVNLLVRHPAGMSKNRIADELGLGTDLLLAHRDTIIAGVLEQLIYSGRILWDAHEGVYVDNPSQF